MCRFHPIDIWRQILISYSIMDQLQGVWRFAGYLHENVGCKFNCSHAGCNSWGRGGGAWIALYIQLRGYQLLNLLWQARLGKLQVGESQWSCRSVHTVYQTLSPCTVAIVWPGKKAEYGKDLVFHLDSAIIIMWIILCYMLLQCCNVLMILGAIMYYSAKGI